MESRGKQLEPHPASTSEIQYTFFAAQYVLLFFARPPKACQDAGFEGE